MLMVKLADRLHNMRTIAAREARKSAPRIAQETMDIYAPLAGRMGMQTVRDELEDIAFRVLNPDANKIIQDRLAQLHEESGDVLREIEKALVTKLGRKRHQGGSLWPREAALFHLAQDGAQASCRWASSRIFSVSA